jgi:NAD+ synthase
MLKCAEEVLMNEGVPEFHIDPKRVADIIVDFLDQRLTQQGRDGILLGLSGGVDSAVVAALAVRATGPRRVHALYLFDRDSAKRFRGYAQRWAARLGINFEARNITSLVREKGIYRPFVLRLTRLLPGLRKPFVYGLGRLYRLLAKGNPFDLVLQKGKPLKGRSAQTIYRAFVGGIERGFNVRHITRRQLLEEYASSRNLLLVSAANRSEYLVGWFVREGVDDLPVAPLLGLYKTQVRQLAHFLDVPREIIAEAPSPDMFGDISDEAAIGFPYDKIDKVLYLIEHDQGEGLALAEGLLRSDFDGIKRLYQLSAWKRETPHLYPLFH